VRVGTRTTNGEVWPPAQFLDWAGGRFEPLPLKGLWHGEIAVDPGHVTLSADNAQPRLNLPVYYNVASSGPTGLRW